MNANACNWLTALRSGDYKQAKAALRTGDGFCCLGVATDLYLKEFGGEWQWSDSNNCKCGQCADSKLTGYYTAIGDEHTTLPLEVQEWLELASDEGRFEDGLLYSGSGGLSESSLAQLNDSGITFEAIADIIESEPEGLFVG